jgi:uncharacterized repeat protein (TIGR03803 family)
MPIGSATVLRAAAIIAAGTMGAAGAAHAATLSPLHPFCNSANCSDGSEPEAGLLLDPSGNLFGTATSGGTANNGGTVFELALSGGTYTFHVIHAFCHNSTCPDGQLPNAGLIRDVNGNLYGLAEGGGAHGEGSMFELSPSDIGWTFKVLYNFCSHTGCNDGVRPLATLSYQGESTGTPYDGTSPLYGTTNGGGAHNEGVVFQLKPSTTKRLWAETTLHAFCSRTNCADGGSPTAGVLIDGPGNIFGVSGQDGAHGYGLAYEIPAGGSFTVLYAFCQIGNCVDGAYPTDIAFNGSGGLIGTTQEGGTQFSGTIFQLTPNGTHSTETVLYNFCIDDVCSDGAQPRGGLKPDGAGNYYGVTQFGGASNEGVIFKWTGSQVRVLHSFCAQASCADGDQPFSGVTLDAAGNVFGTTPFGGAEGSGVAYKLLLAP